MYKDNSDQLEKTACKLRPPSLRENLNNQLDNAKCEVLRLEEAITLLDANPDVQRILELLGQKHW